MSEILQMHFSDLDDIKFEEFYDFFCTDVSIKTKNNLHDTFLKIKGDRDEVSFEDIARFYCEEDYDELVSILDFLTNASEKMEEIYAKKDILNEDFIPNMIEKIVYYDIETRMRSFHESLSKITKILDGNIKKIKKESELEAKIKDIVKVFKQSPNVGHQDIPVYDRSTGAKIEELQNRLNDFQREIDTLKGGFFQQNNDFGGEKISYSQKEKKSDSFSYEKLNFGAGGKTDFLTGHVWPKSRMLLAIVSKMSKEGLLNPQQKGVLKDLIIDDDSRIVQCLRQYEIDGNRKTLYKNCLNLAMRAKVE